MFQKATRQKSKLRLGICAPSGGGKTYSALLIAQGLGGKIAVIDTERGSASLYANLCEFDVCEIEPPFSPEKYCNAIKFAETNGYSVIIIDSLSHAWAGTGGLLEEVDKRKSTGKGNDFTAWRDVTPMHNALIDAMLQSTCHIVATMRTKTAYDMVKDEKTGKVKPVKVGLAPVQREGMDYEFTTVLDIDVEKHMATASKDRTGLFDGKYFVPTVETGKQLLDWLNEGVDAPAPILNKDSDFDLAAVIFEVTTANTQDELKEIYFRYKNEAYLSGHGPALNNAVNTRKADLEAMANKDSTPGKPSSAQLKAMQAYYSKRGLERDDRLQDMSTFQGREIKSFSDLTSVEASRFIEAINSDGQEAMQ